MKIVMLILGFALIFLAAYLFTGGSKVVELQPYKSYFWIPIPLGIMMFAVTFLQKAGDKEKKTK